MTETCPDSAAVAFRGPSFGQRLVNLVRPRPQRLPDADVPDFALGPDTRTAPHPGTLRALTCLVALAALTIAAVVPVSWFLAARAGIGSEVSRHLAAFLERVNEAARQDPDLWNALADSVPSGDVGQRDFTRLLDTEDARKMEERRRVLSVGGFVLTETKRAEPLAWPVLTSRQAVSSFTTPLGAVEISRSLRPALVNTAIAAACSCVFGLLMFTLLRLAPLRIMRAAVDHAVFISAHDVLTGLPNRRLLQDRLHRALQVSARYGRRTALLYMDLDHFKAVNDLLGHPAGDTMLRAVAVRLRRCMRVTDTLARLGGDEFAVIMTELKHPEEAEVLAMRLIAAVAPPVDLGTVTRQIGLSVGISVADPMEPVSSDQMMKQADIALYQAKHAGRGCLRFFEPEMNTKLRDRHDMEDDLRAAILRSGLMIYYQAQTDLATGALVGAEALVRWNRQEHGFTQPDQFIGLAEDTNLIIPLGAWVLREGCQRAANWPETLGIAVNVSPIQLRDRDFCRTVAETLALTGLAPARLALEVTESVMLHDTAAVLDTLYRLREMGVRLALDDFGTGYSSLSYLQKFRFDKLKIDRSFVTRLGQEANAGSIVAAILAMANALGIRVIAEGVETGAQADALRIAGCAEAQGYYFGRPLPEEAFEAMIQAGSPGANGPVPTETSRTIA